MRVLMTVTVAGGAVFHGHRSSAAWLDRSKAPIDPVMQLLVDNAEVPDDFDWRNVNGVNYVTSDVNQHIPQYCGSCWIHGTTAALNDRIKVLREAAYPDVMLARQVIMNCVDLGDGKPPPGCGGGDAFSIHSYIHNHPMPDDTCLPYQARNMECEPVNICRNCFVNGTCFPITSYTEYGVSHHGNVSGEVKMMKEIYSRGPIVCSLAADHQFMFQYGETVADHEGVFVSNKTFTEADVDHDVEVAGWGVTPSGIKYWVVRNSWGTYWGEHGWFKMHRGDNHMMIESDCNWAVPTWGELEPALSGRVMGDYLRGVHVEATGGWEFAVVAAPSAVVGGMVMLAAVAVMRRRGRSDLRTPLMT